MATIMITLLGLAAMVLVFASLALVAWAAGWLFLRSFGESSREPWDCVLTGLAGLAVLAWLAAAAYPIGASILKIN